MEYETEFYRQKEILEREILRTKEKRLNAQNKIEKLEKKAGKLAVQLSITSENECNNLSNIGQSNRPICPVSFVNNNLHNFSTLKDNDVFKCSDCGYVLKIYAYQHL